jgi:hypothetical protein
MTLYVPVLEGNVRKVMPFGRLLVHSPINRDISNFCKQAVVSELFSISVILTSVNSACRKVFPGFRF